MATSTTQNTTTHQGAAATTVEAEPSASPSVDPGSGNIPPEHNASPIMPMRPKEIELVAQCLCKAHTFTTRIPVPTMAASSTSDERNTEPGGQPKSKAKSPTTGSSRSSLVLPLEAVYCHCTSCRRSTGGMYSVSVVWPGEHSHKQPQDHQTSSTAARLATPSLNLKRYKRSENTPATGLFCGSCSSLLFYELVLPSRVPRPRGSSSDEPEEQTVVTTYGVFLGCLRAFELDDAGNRIGLVTTGEKTMYSYSLVRAKDHLFVGDTVDGGATCWLKGRGLGARGEEHAEHQVKMWLGHRPPRGVTGTGAEEFTLPRTTNTNVSVKRQVERGNGVQREDDCRDQHPALHSQAANQPEVRTEQDPTSHLLPALEPGQIPEHIQIKCHCAGVNLILQTGQSRREYLRRIEKQNQEDIPWFVNKQNGKLRGSIDACDSCTTSSGSDLFYWTFAEARFLDYPSQPHAGAGSGLAASGATPSGAAPSGAEQLQFPRDTLELKAAVEENMRRLEDLEQPGSSSDSGPNQKEREDHHHRLGTLSLYASSPDVQRYFCSRCSASIFYACDDRPEMVDIAMGVICSPSSEARAEEVISWAEVEKVGWRDDILAPGSGRGWARDILSGVEAALGELARKGQFEGGF